jgi:hypothetical protein
MNQSEKYEWIGEIDKKQETLYDRMLNRCQRDKVNSAIDELILTLTVLREEVNDEPG